MTLKKFLKKIRTKVRATSLYKHIINFFNLNISVHIPHVYDINSNTNITLEKTDIKTTTVVWYVPYWTNFYGGGHLTIFRFAHLLSKYNQHIIYITGWCRDYKTPSELMLEFHKEFPNCTIKIITSSSSEIPENHIAIATTWQSVFDVVYHSKNKQKFYLMQDYESYFYAFSTQSIQANATYSMGLNGITGGTWLKKCFESHGGSAYNYVFSVDKTIFYPNKHQSTSVKKLFYYYRPTTERRCGELGLNILSKIHKMFPEIEICIAGYNGNIKMPFPATMYGNMTAKQTGDLYRTCDVGIALSGTNLSYLPVELMACGVPVLTNNGANVEWFCNENNSLLCTPFPHSFTNALWRLIHEKDLREKIIQEGLITIAKTSWEQEADGIYNYIASKLQ